MSAPKTRKPSSFMWLCGGVLAVNLLMVVGVLAVLGWYGLGYFWQKRIQEFELNDGTVILAEVFETEEVLTENEDGSISVHETTRVKIGNRELYGLDFRFIDEDDIASESQPEDVVVLERWEEGNFYGHLKELRRGDEVLVTDPDECWATLIAWITGKHAEREAIEELDKVGLGAVTRELDELKLELKRIALEAEDGEEEARLRVPVEMRMAELEKQDEELSTRMFNMRDRMELESAVLITADGREHSVRVSEIVRAVRPNNMSFVERVSLYATRVKEFLWDDPRNSNTEGGIFPAIFGTVMMVFLMSIAAVPLGVLAALYLREYARQGTIVRLVRIAVNNLAGVPSIVFGVFGLGFFVYGIGGTIDEFFYPESLPTPTFGTGGILWGSLTLALLTVPVVIVATEEGLAAVPRAAREGSLALGATKFETVRRVILPAAAPGIMTGAILAVARAAGEVAPLMIVGMVKLADVPVDSEFPFVHFDRKFMHLGFHIYDLGFQSPNVEAARPLVFATAFLLVMLVIVMNLLATWIRNHLRRKYSTSAV